MKKHSSLNITFYPASFRPQFVGLVCSSEVFNVLDVEEARFAEDLQSNKIELDSRRLIGVKKSSRVVWRFRKL